MYPTPLTNKNFSCCLKYTTLNLPETQPKYINCWKDETKNDELDRDTGDVNRANLKLDIQLKLDNH